MPIEIRLNSEQFEHYETVLNKAKQPFKARNSIINLAREDFYTILNTLKDVHAKNLTLKTKGPLHFERLYNLQQIIGLIEAQSHYFPVIVNEPEIDNENDNEEELPEDEAA